MKHYYLIISICCLMAAALFVFQACSDNHLENSVDKRKGDGLQHTRRADEKAHRYNTAAVALAAEGKRDQALAHLSKALEVKPDFAPAHYNMGTILSGQGKLDEAIEHFSEALLINADYAEAHNSLGVALAKQGRVNDAAFHFSQALRIDPEFSEAHSNLKRAVEMSYNSESRANTTDTP